MVTFTSKTELSKKLGKKKYNYDKVHSLTIESVTPLSLKAL